MKIFSSELAYNYGTYTFGYAQYGELEEGDKISEIYDVGFLPYSGSPDAPNTLYMARSARVVLPEFSLTSENRRIAKKFDGMFQKKRISVQQFSLDNKFISFCLDYFAEKHGISAMPRTRLEFILRSPFISDVVIYTKDDQLIACVFEMREGLAGHFWFSFYSLSFLRQSLGMWLMLDCAREAKVDGLDYYYLGTIYGEKALYKTNFELLEWWDGSVWQRDLKMLKDRGRTDDSRVIANVDTWKEGKKLF